MSSTSQLTTFSDLYTDLLNRVRVSSSVAATVEQAKRYINIALHDIHLGFEYKLPWCEANYYLRTKAPYTTGTLTATNGSTVFSGAGTLWNTNDAFGVKNVVSMGKIIVAGNPTVYKVSTVTSDVSLGMYTYYEETTVSGSEYTYFEDEYALTASFIRPVDFGMFSPPMGIALISRAEFRKRYPVVNIQGKPKVACIVDTSTTSTDLTPSRRVIFYPYPDKAYVIPYTYISGNLATTSAGAGLTSMTSDSDVPKMPLRYRHAILYHALYHWYRDRKDDARSEQAKAEYTDIMMRIVSDHDIATHTKAHIQPSVGSYHSSAYAPYSHRGGRLIYDLNDDFDSFKR